MAVVADRGRFQLAISGTRPGELAAAVVGVGVGSAATLLMWQWIGVPQDCGFGTVTPAIEYLPQALIVGALIGASVTLPALLVTWLVGNGVQWWAVAVGLVFEVVLLGTGFAFGVAAILVHGCMGAAPPG